MHRVMCAVLAALLIVGCSETQPAAKQRGPHWSDKATMNARSAERRAGGFNAEERRAYRAGVQHIVNQHQKIGSYTIAQVVDQELARERDRARQIGRASCRERVEMWGVARSL